MPRTLSDDDLIEVLEQIIPESKNSAARIAAVRALRELDAGQTPAGRPRTSTPLRRARERLARTPPTEPRAERRYRFRPERVISVVGTSALRGRRGVGAPATWVLRVLTRH